MSRRKIKVAKPSKRKMYQAMKRAQIENQHRLAEISKHSKERKAEQQEIVAAVAEQLCKKEEQPETVQQ